MLDIYTFFPITLEAESKANIIPSRKWSLFLFEVEGFRLLLQHNFQLPFEKTRILPHFTLQLHLRSMIMQFVRRLT